jgi:hypothetical protein
MDKLFTLPAMLTKYESMSHNALKLVFETNENLSDEQKAKASNYHEKLIYLSLLYESSQDSEILQALANLPPLTQEKGAKTPSQRLHATLFVLWTQKGSQGDFETYYRQQMENIINKIKELLV